MLAGSVFKGVFYQSRVPQLIMTTDEKQIMYNPAFIKFLGYSEEDWTTKSLQDISHIQDYAVNKDYLQQLVRGAREEYHLEKRYICRDGSIKTGDLHVSLIQDKEIPYILVQVIDITEKKQVELKKQQSEDRYRLLAENSSDVINLHDHNGHYVYLSPSIQATLGFHPDELIGKHPNEIIHPDDVPLTEEWFNQMKEDNIPVLMTYRARRKSGEYCWFESVVKAVVDHETDEVVNIVSVSRNIDERLETQDQIKKSEKLALLGQMAAAVAHEIRNPLTPIKGFLQLCNDKKQFNEEYLRVVINEISRVESIITDFLHLSKPHEGLNECVDIRELVKEVLTILDSDISFKGGNIHIPVVSWFTTVLGNTNSLKQVLFNIIQNALDAVEHGGSISVNFERESSFLHTIITDDGCGVPEAIMPHLGEPFYSTKEKGTGLGLLISHKIIENHGGCISYHSQAGSGTEVRIKLPLYEEKSSTRI